VIKDQNQDLREWIDYHHAVGVSTFYIYDASPVADPASKVVEDLIHEGVVVYENVHQDPKHQIEKYQRCIDEHRHSHQWLAFIDVDEFIVMDDRTKSIPDMLANFTQYGGVGLNWRVYGSSGHLKRPEGGVKNYSKCTTPSFFENKYIKDIVNTHHVQKVQDPHIFKHAEGYHTVNADKQIVYGSLNEPPTYAGWHVNHYMIKSLEDFEARAGRGNVLANDIRPIAFFHEVDAQCTETCPEFDPSTYKLQV
jgi:Glycosyltransferase family 92